MSNLLNVQLQVDLSKVIATRPILIKEGCSKFCAKCGSSCERKNFWNPFSEILCINKHCDNSKTRFTIG